MRLLIFGGSVFLSQAVAADAVGRGHDVTCACRGASGAIPAGAEHAPFDRATDDPAALGDEFDAVVDVGRTPSWVRRAVAALPEAHWVFVSTISVYPDNATPGGTPDTLAVHEPLHDDPAEIDPVSYGRAKVACEQTVAEAARSSLIVRPGLIVGPGDPTGRFTYWPHRLGLVCDGDGVLAPGSPADEVRVIDVRDLAAWLVDAAERRLTGVFDAVGPVLPMSGLLAAVAAGVGAAPELVWADREFLEAHDVKPWGGPRSLPLWLPRPEYAGMLSHDPAPAAAAGLTARGLAGTAGDTLAWLRATPGATITGLSAQEEFELLAAARGV